MRIFSKSTLRDFWEKHSDAKSSLKAWYEDTKRATWKTPNDIKKSYSSASFIGNNRVVFNIKGNSYRLIVHINYDLNIVDICFIGTHSEYDKVDAETI